MVSLLLAVIYLSFISLGLPDGLLGAAWPSMYEQLGVPVSYMGIVAMIISACTVVSSLMSDRITRRFHTSKVTFVSVVITAVALWGFANSTIFWQLCLWGLPYGLGAGCIDAALNNYVAIYYESRHMSWLHSMWGLGAAVGPYIMGFALTHGFGWNSGYLYIAIIQIVLAAFVFASFPLWKKRELQVKPPSAEAASASSPSKSRPLSFKEIFAISGVVEIVTIFFCYCAVEQTAGQWAASFMVLDRGVDSETAASFASLFYIGITVGRILSGFITYKLSDKKMVRLGAGIVLCGIICIALPLGKYGAFAGLLLIGFGCAPIYPCLIHSTPALFGEGASQAIIGVQMAFAYVGTTVMPPLFGVLVDKISPAVLPVYLVLFAILMVVAHERLVKKAASKC